MVIPHSPIPISSIRPTDILFLLLLGTITELIHRLVSRRTKFRSSAEKNLREQLRLLRYQVTKKRALGPSAFVETSKLERIVLSKEKELEVFEKKRADSVKKMEKVMKYLMLFFNAVIFAVYYGVPVLTVDGLRASALGVTSLTSDDDMEHAAALLKNVMFPLSYIGIGNKIARIGLENKASSISALCVYWSAQVMVGKVYECFEAFAFR